MYPAAIGAYAHRMSSENRRQPEPNVGLCASCRHAGVQQSAKGSHFWRCGLADKQDGFLRYPPLPVERCAGYQHGEPERGRSHQSKQ